MRLIYQSRQGDVDVLGQAIDLNTALPKVHHLFLDGHGSVRQLMKADGTGVESLNTRAERYDYDAYGEAFGWALDDPGTSITRQESALMYAGEQWAQISFHEASRVSASRQISNRRHTR